ncbi:MAG: peroxisomal membrane anchor protein conserved region-domain-containing protein [Linnemannia gamsii]|nr:MAG: peroxisomal membrane anchor protein conserved region-domain-containing protein [Linnemannia gamsii]
MSDSDTTAPAATTGATGDSVQQLLGTNNGGQPMSAEQRNDRREALLKRQRESREKAQQMSAAARANANASSSAPTTATTTSTAVPTTTNITATTATTPVPTPVAVTAPVVADAPVRENMVQQAISFLSSPSVQSAEESKKTAFLEKKGLTLKEIEVARARVAGKATSAPAVSTVTATPVASLQPQQQTTYQTGAGGAPPPVPPRTYAAAPGYAVQQQQQQPIYFPQQQQQVAADPNAFKKKLVLALLISGGVTVLTSVIVKKLIYPMVRGITGARQSLAVSQTEILNKLKEKLLGYKEYLVGLHLGSNRAPAKKIEDSKDVVADKDGMTTTNSDKKTTIEEVDEQDGTTKAVIKTTTTTTFTSSSTSSTAATAAPYISTVKQLDAFSQKLESHSNHLNFEQLKATRAMAQDLAEYITKETYALSTSIAYPTSRYYGYNTGAAAASGKTGAGGLSDPTTPESALKSEIRSLKGMLLNWRNFPVAKEGGGASPILPNLIQQQ